MPVITCPDCGKPGVSDMAPACPGCGFPVAAHIQQRRQQVAQSVQVRARSRPRKLGVGTTLMVQAFMIFLAFVIAAAIILWLFSAFHVP